MEKMVHIKATRDGAAVLTAFHFGGLDAQAGLDAYLAKQRREGYTVEIIGEDPIERETTSREAIYDAEVAPLMSQIIDICKRADIPLVATFQLDDERGPDVAGFMCSTAVHEADACLPLRRAAAALRR